MLRTIIVRIGGIFAWFWYGYNGGFPPANGEVPQPIFDYKNRLENKNGILVVIVKINVFV